jgi:hypothetical protein
MKSAFMLIVASAACLITFIVSHRIFRDEVKLGPPSLLAAAVAGLAFLGLTHGGEGMIAALLIPYEALAITLLLLFLLFWIARLAKSRSNRARTLKGLLNLDSKPKGRKPTGADCRVKQTALHSPDPCPKRASHCSPTSTKHRQ